VQAIRRQPFQSVGGAQAGGVYRHPAVYIQNQADLKRREEEEEENYCVAERKEQ
jgi:hypothetical protein